jgi:hypothetical protein
VLTFVGIVIPAPVIYIPTAISKPTEALKLTTFPAGTLD